MIKNTMKLAAIFVALYPTVSSAQTGTLSPRTSGDHGTTAEHAQETQRNLEVSRRSATQDRAVVNRNVRDDRRDRLAELYELSVPNNRAFGRIGTH